MQASPRPRRRRISARIGVVGALVGTGALLWWARPVVPANLGDLGSWLAGTAPDRIVVALAAAGAWAALAWLALGVLACLLRELPGAAGALCAAAADRITPVVVRRAVEALLGAAVATSVPAAVASPALAAGTVVPAASAVTMAGTVVPAASAATTAGTVVPAASAATTAGDWPDLDRAGVPPHRPTAPPALPRRPRPEVVVRPGDSLWSIAAAALGADATNREIAASWPRWYAANRSRIGPDPDLLHPGTRLRHPPPAPASARGTKTDPHTDQETRDDR